MQVCILHLCILTSTVVDLVSILWFFIFILYLLAMPSVAFEVSFEAIPYLFFSFNNCNLFRWLSNSDVRYCYERYMRYTMTWMWLHESQDENKIWINLQELSDKMTYSYPENLLSIASAKCYLWRNFPSQRSENCFLC